MLGVYHPFAVVFSLSGQPGFILATSGILLPANTSHRPALLCIRSLELP